MKKKHWLVSRHLDPIDPVRKNHHIQTMEYEKEKRLAGARAEVIIVLAPPSRLFMVELLSKGDYSVGELTSLLGADVSTVSKHLSQLKLYGILVDRNEGNRVVSSLFCPCVLKFISREGK